MGSFDSSEPVSKISMPRCSESNHVLRDALSTILEDSEHVSWSGSWISVEELSTVNSLTTALNAAEKVMDDYFGRNDSNAQRGEHGEELRDRAVVSFDSSNADLRGSASSGSTTSKCSSTKDVSRRGHDQKKQIRLVEAEKSAGLMPKTQAVQQKVSTTESDSSDDAQPSLNMVRSWASAPSKIAQPSILPRHCDNCQETTTKFESSSSMITKTTTSDGESSRIMRARTTASQSLDTVKALEWKLRVEKVKAKLRKRVAEKNKKDDEERALRALPSIHEDHEDPPLAKHSTESHTSAPSTQYAGPSSSFESFETGATSDSWREDDEVDHLSNQMNFPTISIQSQGISKLSSIQSESMDNMSSATVVDSQVFLSPSSQIASFSEDNLSDAAIKHTIRLPELREANFRSFSSEEDVILTNVSSTDSSWTQSEPQEQTIIDMDQVQAQANSKMNLVGVMVLDSEDKADGKLVNAILSDQRTPHSCTIETTLIDMNCVDEPNDGDSQLVDCSAAFHKLVEDQEKEKTQNKRGWGFSSVARKFRDRVKKEPTLH